MEGDEVLTSGSTIVAGTAMGDKGLGEGGRFRIFNSTRPRF